MLKCLDSILFEHAADAPLPIQVGNFLGDMELVYPADHQIISYHGGGSKAYALRIREPDGQIKTCLKVRGVTLNHKTSQLLNNDTFEDLVDSIVDKREQKQIATPFEQILPIIPKGVFSRTGQKIYKAVCQKGYLGADHNNIYPFGF